jgi:hypothetical protein
MTENIKTRIHFVRKNGRDISFFTDKEVLDKLGLAANHEFKDLFELNIGTIIKFEDEVELKIVEINTNFLRETFDNSKAYGMNSNSYGERYPYNFEITYVFDEVN